MLPTLSSLPPPQPLRTPAPLATSLEKPPTMPPLSLQNLYMSNYLMAISSVLLALLPSIGPAYHAVPHRLMSFPNLTHTPSFQLASFATMIALQFPTNTMSPSHATTIASFMEPAYPMDFGAYHSTPHNHRPMPSYQPTHKKTLYNGSMLPPSALASVPSSMELNEISLPHGQTLPPNYPSALTYAYCHRKRTPRPTTAMTTETHCHRTITITPSYQEPQHLHCNH